MSSAELRELKELGKQIGGLGNKSGSFTKGIAYRSVEKVSRDEFGIDNIAMRVKVRKGGGERDAARNRGWHLLHVGDEVFKLDDPAGFKPKIHLAVSRKAWRTKSRRLTS